MRTDYFTTNGTTPTTASSVYFGPIAIATPTTLKYFSRDRAGNQEAVKTQTYTVDAMPPTGTIMINSGAAYTRSGTVTLNLSCTDNVGCYQMQFSSDSVTWSSAVNYATTRNNWSLSARDGTKAVYVRYSDRAGNWSAVFSDTIIFDSTAPVNGTLSAVASRGSIALTWSGFSDALSGIAGYTLVFRTTSAPSSCSAGTVLYAGPGTAFNHAAVVGGTTYYYRLCSTDLAGNVSSGATRSVVAR